jgi:hypothetical protein
MKLPKPRDAEKPEVAEHYPSWYPQQLSIHISKPKHSQNESYTNNLHTKIIRPNRSSVSKVIEFWPPKNNSTALCIHIKSQKKLTRDQIMKNQQQQTDINLNCN